MKCCPTCALRQRSALEQVQNTAGGSAEKPRPEAPQAAQLKRPESALAVMSAVLDVVARSTLQSPLARSSQTRRRRPALIDVSLVPPRCNSSHLGWRLTRSGYGPRAGRSDGRLRQSTRTYWLGQTVRRQRLAHGGHDHRTRGKGGWHLHQIDLIDLIIWSTIDPVID